MHGEISQNWTQMQNKAYKNIEAAKRIIEGQDETYCFASVHCSYYAVFQLMKFLLANLNNNPISYEKQVEICSGNSSHEVIISKIRDNLPGKNYKKERELVEAIRVLKKQRGEADYSDAKFSIEECLDIKQNAEGLMSKLQSLFNDKIIKRA